MKKKRKVRDDGRTPKAGDIMFVILHNGKIAPCMIDAVYEEEDEIWITVIARRYQLSGSKMAFYDIGETLFWSIEEAKKGSEER